MSPQYITAIVSQYIALELLILCSFKGRKIFWHWYSILRPVVNDKSFADIKVLQFWHRKYNTDLNIVSMSCNHTVHQQTELFLQLQTQNISPHNFPRTFAIRVSQIIIIQPTQHPLYPLPLIRLSGSSIVDVTIYEGGSLLLYLSSIKIIRQFISGGLYVIFSSLS